MRRTMEKELVLTDDSSLAKSSADSDTLQSPLPPIDPVAEKKLKRKLDLNILPVLTVLYTLAFIDRINIGNAQIQGLPEDLGFKGNDYNIALFVFFIPYILFEVPSNVILRKVSPSIWITSIMLLWGITTIAMGFVTSLGGLVACRFFLGLFEAGFVPGCFYLISMYYKRYEVQWRFNLFFGGTILSGAWAGLLAAAIANMDGIAGYSGWRWIFIIEGVATVLAAVVGKFFIVDWPETAKFLNEEERVLLQRRLHEERGDAEMNRLDKKAARRVFSDWKIYVGTLMYMGVVNIGYSTSFFIPSILKQLGWTSARAQVMSIPIYVVATIICLCAALLTDRLKHRYAFTMAGVLVATIGLVMLMAQKKLDVPVRYFALYLVVCGGYITQPICIGWLNNNMGGHYKRAVSSAMQIGFGNLGGIVASNIFIISEQPTYPTGYGVCIGMIWLTGLACTVFAIGLWLENRKRDRGGRDYRYELPKEELENLGDDHPSFRFGY